MMQSFKHFVVVLALTLVFASPCCAQSPDVNAEEQATKTTVFMLGPTRIEQKKILSMQGPTLREDILLGNDPLKSTIWLKSLRVETFDDQGPLKTGEFICHSRLKIKARDPQDKQTLSSIRSLGAGTVLPLGYGMRLDNLKSSPMLLLQTLNVNAAPAFNARFRMTVKYIEDEDAKKLALKSTYGVLVAVLKKDVDAQNHEGALQSKNPNFESGVHQCSDDDLDPNTPMSDSAISDTTTFMVPPGRHTYLTVLGREHPIYKGGRILMLARHYHAYGESVDLIDQTTGDVILPSLASNMNQPALTAKIDTPPKYTGGVLINPSHTYAIRAVYNNTTNEPVVGMGIVTPYIADEN